MSGKTLEDEIILSLLDRGDPTAVEPVVAESDEAETLRRLYTEVMGLLPLAISPVEPRPELKERLLAAIVAGAPVSPPTAPLAPILSIRPGEGSHPAPAVVEPTPTGPSAATSMPEPRATRDPRRRLWPLGLAASIALIATSGLIFSFRQDLGQADQQITELRGRLAGAITKERELTERLSRLQQDHSSLVQKLSLITQVGTTACPLRPGADGPALARGVLYVAADHQHWLLKVAGLPPPGFGRTYQLWFLTESGVVSGGQFETNSAATAELGSPSMPAGIRGFAITLEPKPGGPQPTGPRLLAGDEVMQLL